MKCIHACISGTLRVLTMLDMYVVRCFSGENCRNPLNGNVVSGFVSGFTI